jgi:hypothetical protein
MLDLVDHPPDGGRVVMDACLLMFRESQGAHRAAMRTPAARSPLRTWVIASFLGPFLLATTHLQVPRAECHAPGRPARASPDVESVERGPYDVDRVVGPEALGEDVRHPRGLDHGAHRSSGDHPVPGRGRTQSTRPAPHSRRSRGGSSRSRPGPRTSPSGMLHALRMASATSFALARSTPTRPFCPPPRRAR